MQNSTVTGSVSISRPGSDFESLISGAFAEIEKTKQFYRQKNAELWDKLFANLPNLLVPRQTDVTKE